MRDASRLLFVAMATLASLVAASLPARAAPGAEMVAFSEAAAPGSIIVRTGERRLYLVLGDGRALRYVVGVGRDGRQWSGTAAIEAMFLRPNWVPPPEIRRDQPNLPALIPGGSPANPMGAAALTLSGGAYAIHGTNDPASIGGFVSYGCIRMHDRDILDLYARVRPGTMVVVTR